MNRQALDATLDDPAVNLPRARDRSRTLADLQLALHRLQRVGKKVSIKGVADEANVSASLIHNRYPDFAEQIRALSAKATRAQRDEKHDLLQLERDKNRALRSAIVQLNKEVAAVAEVNEALNSEINLLKAMTNGNVHRGKFKEEM